MADAALEVVIRARDEATAQLRAVRGELQALSRQGVALTVDDRVTPAARRIMQTLSGLKRESIRLEATDGVSLKARQAALALQAVPDRRVTLHALNDIPAEAARAAAALRGLPGRTVALDADNRVPAEAARAMTALRALSVTPVVLSTRDEASARIRAVQQALAQIPRRDVPVGLRDEATAQFRAITRGLQAAPRVDILVGTRDEATARVRAIRSDLQTLSRPPVILAADDRVTPVARQVRQALAGLNGTATLTARDDVSPRIRTIQQLLRQMTRHEVTLAARDEVAARFQAVTAAIRAQSRQSIVLAAEDRVTPVSRQVARALTSLGRPPILLQATDQASPRVLALQQLLSRLERQEITLAARDEASARYRAVTEAMRRSPRVDVPMALRDDATPRVQALKRELATVGQGAPPVLPAVAAWDRQIEGLRTRIAALAATTAPPVSTVAPGRPRAVAPGVPGVPLPAVAAVPPAPIPAALVPLQDRLTAMRARVAALQAAPPAAPPPPPTGGAGPALPGVPNLNAIHQAAGAAGSALRTAAQTAGTLGRALLGLGGVGGALSVAAVGSAFLQLGRVMDADIDKVVSLNRALRSLDASQVLGALEQVNAELEKMGERAARMEKGGLGGLLARWMGGAQEVTEALGLTTPPEELAARARAQARVATQVSEGQKSRDLDQAARGLAQQGTAQELQQALASGNLGAAAALRQRVREQTDERERAELEDLRRKQIARRPPAEAMGSEAADALRREASTQAALKASLEQAARLAAQGRRGEIPAEFATLSTDDLQQRIAAAEKARTTALTAAAAASATGPAPTLAREAKERAEVEAKYAQERKQQAAEALDLERQLASTQAQGQAQTIGKARDLATTRIESLRQIVAAEAGRFLTLDQHHAVELSAIQRTRQVQLDALRAIADAQVRAATGPTRDVDVARIRRDQAIDEAGINDQAAARSVALAQQTFRQKVSQEEAYFQLRRTLGDASLADEVRRQQQIVDQHKRGTDARVAEEQRLAALQKQLRESQELAALGPIGEVIGDLKSRGFSLINRGQVEAELARRDEQAPRTIDQFLSGKSVQADSNALNLGILDATRVAGQRRAANEAGLGGPSSFTDALRSLMEPFRATKEGPDIGARFSIVEARQAELEQLTQGAETLRMFNEALLGATGTLQSIQAGTTPTASAVPPAMATDGRPASSLKVDVVAADTQNSRRIVNAVAESIAISLERDAGRGIGF